MTEPTVASLDEKVKALEALVTRMADTTLQQSRGVEQRLSQFQQSQATTAEKLSDLSTSIRDLGSQVNTAVSTAERARDSSRVVQHAVDTAMGGISEKVGSYNMLCPKEVICIVERWEPRHFETEIQRKEWFRMVNAKFNDDRGLMVKLSEHVRDHSEIERLMELLPPLVESWAMMKLFNVPAGQAETGHLLKEVVKNTQQEIHKIFAHLQLLRIKLHPHGGIEAMKRAQEKRKAVELPQDLLVEWEDMERDYAKRIHEAQVVQAAQKLGDKKKGNAAKRSGS